LTRIGARIVAGDPAIFGFDGRIRGHDEVLRGTSHEAVKQIGQSEFAKNAASDDSTGKL
jgi:hypothetical protein